MKELSLSFGHFKREDELPLTIIVNGCTYQSQPLVDATKKTYFEMGKKEATFEKVNQFNKGYEIGKYEGYEAGKKANGYSEDDIKQLHTDNEYTRKIWYDKGKAEGYGEGYTDGYEQCKHDGISKINLNTEPVEQTELSKEYDKGFTKGYEEGFEEGKSEGYEIGKKANGISKKEIPGEYLSRIEEARLMGYEQGRSDCREATLQKKLLQEHIMEYGRDEDGPCNDCKEEPGRDEDDGELIGPEHPEYDKGYYAGWEDGKNHIMQFIGNESSR